MRMNECRKKAKLCIFNQAKFVKTKKNKLKRLNKYICEIGSVFLFQTTVCSF